MTSGVCIWPGCEVSAPCVCSAHWKQLPGEIREALGRSFSLFEQSRGYVSAVERARSWIRRTFAGREERIDLGRWERLVRFVRDRDEARRARRAGAVTP